MGKLYFYKPEGSNRIEVREETHGLGYYTVYLGILFALLVLLRVFCANLIFPI